MKNNNEKEQLSLLDSPVAETQQKDKPYLIVIRTFIILMLFVVMFCSFLLSFSGQATIGSGEKKYLGIFSAKNFYNTSNCSLIVAKEVKSVSDISLGEEVLYSSASETGTALFCSTDGIIVELERENGETFLINKNYVVGVVTKKEPGVGFFLAFLQTSVGGIVAMVLLLAYAAYLSFSRINYENTKQGKELFALYQKEKQENAKRKAIFKLMQSVQGVDEKIAEMLSGSIDENKKVFYEFESDKFDNLTNKYEYVLYRLHEALVVKEKLSKQERKCVSSLLQLLPVVDHVNQNIEYMMVDLLLKGSLVGFKEKAFESGISVLLSKELDDQDLLNIGSILYITALKNSWVDKNVITDILLEYSKKSEEMGKGTQSLAKNISLSIAKCIK